MIKRFINSFTLGGKIILVLNCVALIGAFVVHRYVGLPFVVISVICTIANFRE